LISRVIQEQIVEAEFEYHVTFSSGDVEIVEMHIGPIGETVTVAGFEVDGQMRVAAVRRDGRTLIPRGDFELREGDLIVAAAKHGVTAKVGKYLVTDGGDEL
jgi:Trk K+ transport system NAD-binding subunit